MSHSPLVLVVVLRSRLGIEAVCQDGTRMHGESKWREFRSYHPKCGRGQLGHDAKQIRTLGWLCFLATSGMD
jgi:hypothetical protein